MRESYLVKVIYKKNEMFLIWYSDEQDGFYTYQDKLLTFTNIEEAKYFAEKQQILLETEMAVYDFSNTFALINMINCTEKCRILLDTWNFFSDLSKSLNVAFIGDSNDNLITCIYDKLFYGSNLKIINGSYKYHPTLDAVEKEKCKLVFLDGFSILDKELEL